MATAKRLSSGKWSVNIYVGREDGKRKYKRFTASTKKEAEFLAVSYLNSHHKITYDNITLGEAIKQYIQSKENILSPTTVRGYRNILKNNLDKVANLKLKEITPQIIQAEINRQALLYSSKSCRNTHGLISTVLKIWRPDLTLKTTLPTKKQKDIYVPDTKEVKKISKLAEGHSIYIPFLLATQCGLRSSEICGLKLENVYPDHIDIKQVCVRGEHGNVVKQPKSFSGYRTIPIDKELYKILKENAVGDDVFPCNSDSIPKFV